MSQTQLRRYTPRHGYRWVTHYHGTGRMVDVYYDQNVSTYRRLFYSQNKQGKLVPFQRPEWWEAKPWLDHLLSVERECLVLHRGEKVNSGDTESTDDELSVTQTVNSEDEFEKELFDVFG